VIIKPLLKIFRKQKTTWPLTIASLLCQCHLQQGAACNANSQLSSSQQQLARTKKQVEAGALSKSNELNLDAQVATNELNVITERMRSTLHCFMLKQALQLPASTPLDVIQPDLNIEDLVLDQDRNEIYEIARATLPEVKSAGLKVQSAEYNVKHLGKFLPSPNPPGVSETLNIRVLRTAHI
jgi:outer membrane protein